MKGMGLPDLDVIFKDAASCSGARSVISGDDTLAGLGHLMRSAREEIGFGLRETARLTGMTPTQIARVEQGVDARISSCLRLAQAYGCRVRVRVSFPEMGPLWRKANLRRREEHRARQEERTRRRLARRGRLFTVPPSPPAA